MPCWCSWNHLTPKVSVASVVQVQSLTRQVEEGQAQAVRLGADLQAAQAAFADAQMQLARLDADASAQKARADQVQSWLLCLACMLCL